MKKQPDKITAYYYRAANKQTDLNLDNQMHRLYRNHLAAVQFLDDIEQRGISICSITDGDLPLCRELYRGIVNAYRSSSEKGGEFR